MRGSRESRVTSTLHDVTVTVCDSSPSHQVQITLSDDLPNKLLSHSIFTSKTGCGFESVQTADESRQLNRKPFSRKNHTVNEPLSPEAYAINSWGMIAPIIVICSHEYAFSYHFARSSTTLFASAAMQILSRFAIIKLNVLVPAARQRRPAPQVKNGAVGTGYQGSVVPCVGFANYH
ncbi:hypothetical protein B0H12DRAFT_1073284 [Mycena haematopus]|nr:hypothetical protein B0H12DRAFT_1073284 [Mycena haematopus]